PRAGTIRTVVFRLGSDCDPAIVRGVDTVIHGAWDLDPGAASRNIESTKGLVELAEGAGASHQGFLSTNSWHEAAVSAYGRAKLAVQDYMLARGHAVARIGLVIGPGGIFHRLSQTVARHRMVPLLDGGRAPVPIISIADLVEALAVIVERRLTGLFNLFNPEPVSLRRVLLETRAMTQRQAVLVPVPSGLVLAPIWLLGKLGIRLPIDADNVRGWRANAGERSRSDLLQLVPSPLTLEAMIRVAAETDHATSASTS